LASHRATAPRLTGAHAALRIPDATLVEKVGAGDWESFHAIYDRYASRVYGLCTQAAGERPTGRVLVKDVFVLTKKHLKRLKDPMRLRDWMQAITVEVIRTHRLGGKKKTEIIPVEPERLRVEGEDEFLPLLRELKAALVSQTVGTAKDPKVKAILEAYYRAPKEPTAEELGAAVGVPPAQASEVVEKAAMQINRSLMATLALLDGPIDEPVATGGAAAAAAGCPLADPTSLDKLAEGHYSRRELDVIAQHLSSPCASCEQVLAATDLPAVLGDWAERLESNRTEPRPGELGIVFREMEQELKGGGGGLKLVLLILLPLLLAGGGAAYYFLVFLKAQH
jgi:DNA-directed RNA polymerase specialized sigma24 family protein